MLITPRPRSSMWIAGEVGRDADQHVAHPLDLDHVVRDQPVAAVDEVERALRLPDPALAQDQHAQAEHVQEHRVQVQPGGQPLLEEAPRAA